MIRNSYKYTFLAGTLMLVGLLPTAQATTLPSLHDWCVNINGDSSSLCNTGQTSVVFPSGVDGSGFDFTLDSQTEGSPVTPFSGYPSTVNDLNTLGSFTITLTPGAGQYVLAYFDYDLNYNVSGSFGDKGSVHGMQPMGTNFSINDPNYCTDGCTYSDLFDQFQANTLDNFNSVSVFAPDGVCCDVGFALGVNLDVAVNTLAHITFTVTTANPELGFFLQQTNGVDDSQNIYFKASVDVESTGSETPEPASLFLIGGGLVGAFLLRKRHAA